MCPCRCHNDDGGIVSRQVSLAGWGVEGTPQTTPGFWLTKFPLPSVNLLIHVCPWIVDTIMVTLITEQLRKQSLEEPYHKAFSFNVNVVSSWSPHLCFCPLKCSFALDSSESDLSYHILLCYSHCLQWAQVPLSHGVHLDRDKVSPV